MSELTDRALGRVRAGLGPPVRVADRYEIRALLGRGGMGEVYRAHDAHLGRDVALKVLAVDVPAAALAERLRRESRVLARLEHPGIIPVYDAGVLADGRAFYVMRLVEGARLDEYAARAVSRGELLRTLLRVADAVAFAHGRGVIHRDLKPGNVMIGPFGEVLVLDWGVAKVLAHAGDGAADADVPSPPRPGTKAQGDPLTADGTAVGTPGYMAPEQASGGTDVDERADVHALGVILRELVAVHPERAPKALAAIVARATAPEAAARYRSVPALAEDLRRWLDGESVLAMPEGPLDRAWRFARRHQVAILLLLGYALVRTMILVWRGI